jgi:hypothetical protein
MKKKLVSILLSFTMPFYGIARAEESTPKENISLPKMETPVGEVDPGEAISPLKRGQRAPFTGVHLSPAAVARIIVELESFPEKLGIEQARLRDELNAQCKKLVDDEKTSHETTKRTTDAQHKSDMVEIKNLTEQLEQEKKNRSNVYLWAGVGVMSGIGITLLTVYAVNKASE